MKKHIELLGILHIVYHGMGLLIAMVVLMVIAGGGIISCNELAITITLAIAVGISVLIFVFAIPGIIGGVGLLRMRPWGRVLALIMGFLALIKIPIGTALGVYTIWALMNDETIKLFEEESPKAV